LYSRRYRAPVIELLRSRAVRSKFCPRVKPNDTACASRSTIALCDGDVRAALRAALVANSFLISPVDVAFRKAMFQMMGVFAEFERSMVQERVRAGLARARSEGKRLGRPPIPAELEKRIRAALNAPGHTEGDGNISPLFCPPRVFPSCDWEG
jgi:hypothetical protein